ncbi:MAG TPA: DNA cytosine methyltransferase [Tepidisphaeraceae bacterium]|nr:DNA cytosine methyltransferase [Tepidisphaeraceae bacterium]
MKNLESAILTTRHGAQLNAGMFDEMIVDNFAGAGGASMGIEAAVGRAVDVAINHDQHSIAMHQINHPNTLHLCEDVWNVDPVQATAGRQVGLAWFSPDCRHFSRAKGGKPVEKKIRGLAWVVIRWARLVSPRLIVLENVREFQEWGPLRSDNTPCPKRKGSTFKSFVTRLRNLGYVVEHRILNAADFGAPTHRRRLFLIARRDGVQIQWPEPTYGPGRKHRYRTAASCIDWSLPCPSIFLTRAEARILRIIRPLADKTMRRIAMGIKRYVLDNPKPFIVTCNHGGPEFRGQSVDDPFKTVTGSRDAHGLVLPFLAANYGEAPHQETRGQKVDEPLRTVTPSNNAGVLIAPTVIQYAAKPRPIDEPAGVVMTENHQALATAFIAKHYGGVVGHAPDRPIGTITAVDHHSVVASHLTKFYGTNVGADVREPMPTVTADGNHVGEVRAFLIKYFGCGCGQQCVEPLHTVTGRDRFGLVTIDGQDFQIIDIGLRMLNPHELLRAQFGKYAEGYILLGTKAQQVARIGNSVPPELAEAVVRANYCAEIEVAA